MRRKQIEATKRIAEKKSANELLIMKRLHNISTCFVTDDSLQDLLSEIVETAVIITKADMGNIQLFDERSGSLKIIASNSFNQKFLDFFNTVYTGQAACGVAIERKERVIIEDVTQSPIFMGTPALEVMLSAGARAVQSTPLFSRSGRFVGMLSTHYHTSCRPVEQDMHLLDMLARQSADILERMQTEEALRQSKARYRTLSEELLIAGEAVQQERDHLSSLINSMSDEVWFTDTNRKYILVNPAAHRQFGPGIIGASIEEVADSVEVLRTDGSPRPIEEAWPLRALQGEVMRNGQEIVRTPATGELRYREVSANPVKDADGNIIGSVSVVRDITERIQIENELRQHQDNLEKLVRERTEEVQRLDRLNLVGEMAASIGHEVRNPLTTVRGYLQMFQRKDKMAEYNEQLGTMIEELDRANSILSEFLSLAKDKRIEVKPTYLNATIRHLLPLLQAAAIRDDKEITTEFTDVPKILVDENEIRQCVLNLTRNALDAVPPGGVVTLSTNWDKRQKTVSISVKDTGTGIPPSVLKTIGKPFVTTKATGTGLGLPICYRIAERHNATVKVDTGSTGTTISIKFPITEPVEK